jgi:hypothetical protein
MSLTRVHAGFSALTLAAALLIATPVSAQVAVSGGVDVTNQYNFRGIRQNFDGVSIWPFIDLGVTTFSGDGAVKTVGINVGSWNAFHSELSDNKWYESDFYGTLGLGFAAGSLGFTYTAYTSPADLFSTVHELAVKGSATASAGGVALDPYALVAFELGDAQADGGASKGTYLELGIAPGVGGDRASLSIPIKVGLSLKDYYEHDMGTIAVPDLRDSTFGYFSIAGLVTVPLGGNANIHGGVELQTFGDTLKAKNAFGDDPLDPAGSAVIGSIGIGFSF